ncbi:MAG: pseudouridine-5'-phosphate glycosidase [Acidimicrobiales bacterium]
MTAVEIELSPDVADAVDSAMPIVALESTIFSHLGLPAPANGEALERCRRAVIDGGAVPALTAILDGRISIGHADPDIICGPARKVAARDISVAVAQRWPYGATTVSASLAIAAQAGIEVFATGGIGGVHRGWEETGDISADLDALASHQVVTVSAGAKVFLDLAATLERLETDSVPVLGWQCDDFPAFHARSSGLAVPHRVESADEVADIARAHWAMGGGGVLVVAPVPENAAIDFARLTSAVDQALAAAAATGVVGNAVTPAILGALADATDGDSIPTNLALAENNAQVAASIAVALAAHW